MVQSRPHCLSLQVRSCAKPTAGLPTLSRGDPRFGLAVGMASLHRNDTGRGTTRLLIIESNGEARYLSYQRRDGFVAGDLDCCFGASGDFLQQVLNTTSVSFIYVREAFFGKTADKRAVPGEPAGDTPDFLYRASGSVGITELR